jgi:hypothetical protein
MVNLWPTKFFSKPVLSIIEEEKNSLDFATRVLVFSDCCFVPEKLPDNSRHRPIIAKLACDFAGRAWVG